ncbi:MAG: hypothetical protein WCP97_03750 [bacterium]
MQVKHILQQYFSSKPQDSAAENTHIEALAQQFINRHIEHKTDNRRPARLRWITAVLSLGSLGAAACFAFFYFSPSSSVSASAVLTKSNQKLTDKIAYKAEHTITCPSTFTTSEDSLDKIFAINAKYEEACKKGNGVLHSTASIWIDRQKENVRVDIQDKEMAFQPDSIAVTSMDSTGRTRSYKDATEASPNVTMATKQVGFIQKDGKQYVFMALVGVEQKGVVTHEKEGVFVSTDPDNGFSIPQYDFSLIRQGGYETIESTLAQPSNSIYDITLSESSEGTKQLYQLNYYLPADEQNKILVKSDYFEKSTYYPYKTIVYSQDGDPQQVIEQIQYTSFSTDIPENTFSFEKAPTDYSIIQGKIRAFTVAAFCQNANCSTTERQLYRVDLASYESKDGRILPFPIQGLVGIPQLGYSFQLGESVERFATEKEALQSQGLHFQTLEKSDDDELTFLSSKQVGKRKPVSLLQLSLLADATPVTEMLQVQRSNYSNTSLPDFHKFTFMNLDNDTPASATFVSRDRGIIVTVNKGATVAQPDKSQLSRDGSGGCMEIVEQSDFFYEKCFSQYNFHITEQHPEGIADLIWNYAHVYYKNMHAYIEFKDAARTCPTPSSSNSFNSTDEYYKCFSQAITDKDKQLQVNEVRELLEFLSDKMPE